MAMWCACVMFSYITIPTKMVKPEIIIVSANYQSSWLVNILHTAERFLQMAGNRKYNLGIMTENQICVFEKCVCCWPTVVYVVEKWLGVSMWL